MSHTAFSSYSTPSPLWNSFKYRLCHNTHICLAVCWQRPCEWICNNSLWEQLPICCFFFLSSLKTSFYLGWALRSPLFFSTGGNRVLQLPRQELRPVWKRPFRPCTWILPKTSPTRRQFSVVPTKIPVIIWPVYLAEHRGKCNVDKLDTAIAA